MKKVGLTIAAVLVLVLACAAIIGYRSQANEVAYKLSESHIYTPEELLAEANKLRAEKGVPPLKLDPRLNQSAQWKADQITKTGEFEHTYDGYHGYQKAKEMMPECKYAGENLDQTDKNESPFENDGWISSNKHYSAEINPRYTYTGFASSIGTGYRTYVQHFCALE